MRKYLINATLFFVLFFVIALLVFQIPDSYFIDLIKSNPTQSGLIFAFLMAISTIIPPITVFIFMPLVGALIGPLTTVIYSVIGWTIGASTSFYIARYFGRPFVSKFMSFKNIEKLEDRIPKGGDFLAFLFLRMILPVDFLSYAMGIFSKMNFWKFCLATFLGVIPFSFVFSYGYDIFFLRSKPVIILAISFVVLILGAFWLYKNKK